MKPKTAIKSVTPGFVYSIDFGPTGESSEVPEDGQPFLIHDIVKGWAATREAAQNLMAEVIEGRGN